jgi:hypothetical protein
MEMRRSDSLSHFDNTVPLLSSIHPVVLSLAFSVFFSASQRICPMPHISFSREQGQQGLMLVREEDLVSAMQRVMAPLRVGINRLEKKVLQSAMWTDRALAALQALSHCTNTRY